MERTRFQLIWWEEGELMVGLMGWRDKQVVTVSNLVKYKELELVNLLKDGTAGDFIQTKNKLI